MKGIFLITSCFLAVLSIAKAQLASDALRYSSTSYSATARSMGVGNSMSALGGDFSTLSINPAGLATYRASDFMLSMGYLNVSTNSQLNGNIDFDNPVNKVTFNNVGIVFNSKPYGNSKWTNTNFAVGLNKLTDFNRTIYYQGNSAGSLITLFKNQANNGQFDEFGNLMAYDAYALYDSTIAGKKRYYSDFDGSENATISRSQTAKTSGRVSELVISYAGNFDEKLMFGITLGVPFAKYKLSNNYGETDANNQVKYFNNMTYKEEYVADGTGVNLKLGAIYRPIQAIRVGLAVHTPTSFTFSETRTNDFIYNYTDGKGTTEKTAQSPEGISDYIINTPWKTEASLGILAGKMGFITAEAEYISYASAKIRFNTPDSIGQTRIQELKQYESELNQDIKATYQSALNLRFGGELALEAFRLRAGMNLLGSAKQGETGFRKVYMVGAGVRGKSMYLDLAYRFENQKFLYQPYFAGNASRQPNVDVSSNSNNFMMTVGFRF